MLSAREIRRVLALYDLGEVERARQAVHGYVNETVFVDTSCGRFVVRRNHRRIAEASHHYRHGLIKHVRAHGVPAPELIAARTGTTLVELDGRYYEVAAFVEGGDYDPQSVAHTRGVGELLAHYHYAVAGYPPPAHTGEPRYSGHNMSALIERLLERDIMGELHEPLAWYTARAAQLAAALPEREYAMLPHLVIHGDVHSDNLRFARDRPVALLDYDQVSWDARIVDLADGLVGFTTDDPGDNQVTWGVYRGPIDRERSALLIEGYTAVEQLTDSERAALPVLIELLWLRGELGRVYSTPEGAPEYHLAVLNQGRALSSWMQANREELIDVWAAMPKF